MGWYVPVMVLVRGIWRSEAILGMRMELLALGRSGLASDRYGQTGVFSAPKSGGVEVLMCWCVGLVVWIA